MMVSIRKEINKLLNEASILCEEGQWEAALLTYQKGLQICPHSMACRAGLLRAGFVIKNAIRGLGDGGSKTLATNAEDISLKKRDIAPLKRTLKTKRIINKVTIEQIKKPFLAEDKPFRGRFENSEFKELTKDLIFIEKAKKDNLFPTDTEVDNLIQHLNLLLKKNERWNKQDSSFDDKTDPNEKQKWKQILENLEMINNSTELLESANKYLNDLETSGLLVTDKMEIEGEIYYLILKANINLGDYKNVNKYNERIKEIVNETGNEELKIRYQYLQGRANALAGNYFGAISTWQEILKTTKNPKRVAHLLHEIGRCYFRLQRMQQARAYGMLSLESAKQANSDVWIKNAAILVAQIEAVRGYKEEALQNYEIAESAARRLNDQRTLFSIICETAKLGKKLRRPKIDEGVKKLSVNKKMTIRTTRTQSSTITLRRPKSVLTNNYWLLKKAKVYPLKELQRKKL